MTRFAQVDMNAVAPLLPGDKVAGRVSARGEHFDWKPQPGKIHSSEPIPVRPPNEHERSLPFFRDLTGARIGRLLVQGIATNFTSTNGQNWAVRCVCGSYETRKAKYIKACLAGNNPGQEEPMCDWCAKTRKLQKGIGVKRDGPLVKIEGYK